MLSIVFVLLQYGIVLLRLLAPDVTAQQTSHWKGTGSPLEQGDPPAVAMPHASDSWRIDFKSTEGIRSNRLIPKSNITTAMMSPDLKDEDNVGCTTQSAENTQYSHAKKDMPFPTGQTDEGDGLLGPSEETFRNDEDFRKSAGKEEYDVIADATWRQKHVNMSLLCPTEQTVVRPNSSRVKQPHSKLHQLRPKPAFPGLLKVFANQINNQPRSILLLAGLTTSSNQRKASAALPEMAVDPQSQTGQPDDALSVDKVRPKRQQKSLPATNRRAMEHRRAMEYRRAMDHRRAMEYRRAMEHRRAMNYRRAMENRRARKRRQATAIPSNLPNVALNKPAWLSSVFQTITSQSAANDGNRDTNSFECVHTEAFDVLPYRFWRVDLERLYRVYYVTILNRGDCCGERLSDFDIRVAKTLNSRTAPELVDDQLCVHREEPVQQGAEIRLNCTGQVLGRYLTLLMETKDDTLRPGIKAPLHICEVGVYAAPAVLVSLGEECAETLLLSPRVCTQGAVCVSVSGKTRCKIPLGDSCNDPNKFHHCIPGAICNLGICRLEYMSDCSANRTMCRSRSSCQDGICRVLKDGNCSGLQEACETSLACDALSVCKIPVGGSCSNTGECMAGAKCQSGTCQCLANFTVQNENKCAPKTGKVEGACKADTDDQCDDKFSNCMGGICKCDTKYPVFAINFTCNTRASCNKDFECGTRSVCELAGSPNASCRSLPGEVCLVSGRQCSSDTICDLFSVTCSYDTNTNCNKNTFLCVTGAVCEDGQKCKNALDQPCTSEGQCVKGTTCDTRLTPNVCRIKVGSDCGGAKSEHCHSSSVCDEGKCRIKAGEACDSNNLCALGTVCQYPEKKCKVKLGHSCLSNDCVKDGVCDIFLMCRLKVGARCPVGSKTRCAAGAVCTVQAGQEATCQCDPAVSRTSEFGPYCEPGLTRIGDSCQKVGDCLDVNADCLNSMCSCKEGFSVEPSDMSCNLAPGSRCGSSRANCSYGSKCTGSGVCELEAGEYCVGTNRGHCIFPTTCEDSVCKLPVNEDCSGRRSHLCKNGTVCDSIQKCGLPVWSVCHLSTTSPCVAGASCTKGICQCNTLIAEAKDELCTPLKKKVGGSCSGENGCDDKNAACVQNLCVCGQDFIVDSNFTCKKQKGMKCGNLEDCISGTKCQDNLCKGDVGSECEGNISLCVSGTVCDNMSRCALDVNQKCEGDYLGLCRTGSVCDNIMMCGLPVGEDCQEAEQDPCVAGAACQSKLCGCQDESIAFLSGLLCLPAAGRVGGTCSAVVPCDDQYSTCEDGVCRCLEGLSVGKLDYTCVPDSLTEATSKALLLVVISSLVLLLALIVIVILRRKRRLKRRDTLATEVRSRRQSMAELEAGVAAVSKKPLGSSASMGAEKSAVGSSVVESSVVESSAVEPSAVEPSAVESSAVEPSVVDPSVAES